MSSATTARPTDDIYDEIIEIVMNAGFVPSDFCDDRPTDLAWIPGYGFDAYRVDGDGSVTMVRFVAADERIDVVNSTRNYLINGEISFPATDRGIAWFAAVVAE